MEIIITKRRFSPLRIEHLDLQYVNYSLKKHTHLHKKYTILDSRHMIINPSIHRGFEIPYLLHYRQREMLNFPHILRHILLKDPNYTLWRPRNKLFSLAKVKAEH